MEGLMRDLQMNTQSEARARMWSYERCRHGGTGGRLAVECRKSPAVDWPRALLHLGACGVKHRRLAWCGGPVESFGVSNA